MIEDNVLFGSSDQTKLKANSLVGNTRMIRNAVVPADVFSMCDVPVPTNMHRMGIGLYGRGYSGTEDSRRC